MEQDCIICFEKINYYDLKVQKCCNKFFHFKCINQWFKTKKTCPLCRREYITITPKEYLELKKFFLENGGDKFFLKIDLILSKLYLKIKDKNMIYFLLVICKLINKIMTINLNI